jgi:outer membrane cobalamin receptor
VGTRDDVDFTAFPAERVTLRGYQLTDAALFLPLAGKVGSGTIRGVSLRVENLLGTDYQTVNGFPGLGRVVRLGARFELGGLKPSGSPCVSLCNCPIQGTGPGQEREEPHA